MNHIVEIYGSRVVSHYALTSELAMTEWLGGIILLTYAEEIDLDGVRSVDAFFERAEATPHKSRCLKAYHITCADMSQCTLTANSKICLIQDEAGDLDCF
ncbi:MAG: hypothetical protein NC206_05805 [Bacteroides sp.]|nr:hypothetical protein [Roseburia sp.]MCM1346581.1 hypothetical protein [Bacteroides sp.]MCM1421405.1 hypothetical protein [Bacteroides sp.]